MNRINSEWCINLKKKIIFISINKNAGTSIRNSLKDIGFLIVDNNKIENKTLEKLINFYFFALIRDPKPRYISGLGHYIFKNINDKSSILKVKKYLENNKFQIDEHTAPQHLSLNKIIDKKEIKFELFQYEQNINDLFSFILKEKINFSKLNTSSFSEKRKICYNIALKLYNYYCENNPLFYDFYEKDFKLYEKCLKR